MERPIPCCRRLTVHVAFALTMPRWWLEDSPLPPQDSPPQTQGRPFVVEYYYKARWGNALEFLALFRKNH
jgi:hypothetical protein